MTAAVEPVDATGAAVTCATPGCGSLGSYLDTSMAGRADWTEVHANGAATSRWYCSRPCAAAGLAPDSAGELVLRWGGGVDVPGPGDPAGSGCRVRLVTAGGGPAVLALGGEERLALSALLDAEIRDINRPCPTLACGVPAEALDASDPALWGWTQLQVGGSDTPLRWYCSPPCVHDALARAGDELAAADDAAGCTPGADA